MTNSPSTGTNKSYKLDRFFISDRGMHLCFETEDKAEEAYNDFLKLGLDHYVLEGSQVIDLQMPRGVATSE